MSRLELNSEQARAVGLPDGPLLIVAGAGTGKTRTLTSRIIELTERGIRPEKICAITFTNKAAREMCNRIQIMTNDNDYNKNVIGHSYGHRNDAPFIGTFHSFGARILRKECRLLGRKPNFVIFDDHDSFGLLKKVLKKILVIDKKDKKSAKEKPAFFAKKIGEIKNLDGAVEELQSSGKINDKLAVEIFNNYEKELERNNAFDFDDLIEKVVKLFLGYPAILEKYRNKFHAILVDEYQDINPVQYKLVRLLAGGHKNLSVVGDDEQMIYGWRHANLETFLGFERDWPNAQIAFLEENYRSSGNIIRAASAVTKNNQHRHPKNLWTKNRDGQPIKIFEALDENEEAERIAAAIVTAATHDSQLTTHNNRNTTSKVISHQLSVISQSTAVLYRTNAQSRALEQALIRRKIPYQVFGGIRFYERREVKDVVAFLRYTLNTKDEISKTRLLKLLGKRHFLELISALETPRKNKLAPKELINLFLKTTNYLEYLENNFIDYGDRQENIAELLRFAERFDDLAQTLEEIALAQPMDRAEERIMNKELSGEIKNHITHNSSFIIPKTDPVVSLMTIHLAKGLEFDNIFIAGCSEGILPHARSMENVYQLEEERRLMYVAMTRARKNLNISFYDVPSRFISEIPVELVEYENPTAGEKISSDYEEKYINLD